MSAKDIVEYYKDKHVDIILYVGEDIPATYTGKIEQYFTNNFIKFNDDNLGIISFRDDSIYLIKEHKDMENKKQPHSMFG